MIREIIQIMIWGQDDSGYLISVDMPETGRCRACGAEYTRTIEDAKPWQQSVPDRCPVCGHVHKAVNGIRFVNRPVLAS